MRKKRYYNIPEA